MLTATIKKTVRNKLSFKVAEIHYEEVIQNLKYCGHAIIFSRQDRRTLCMICQTCIGHGNSIATLKNLPRGFQQSKIYLYGVQGPPCIYSMTYPPELNTSLRVLLGPTGKYAVSVLKTNTSLPSQFLSVLDSAKNISTCRFFKKHVFFSCVESDQSILEIPAQHNTTTRNLRS